MKTTNYSKKRSFKLVLVVMLFSSIIQAQEANKFKLHSVSFGIGYFDNLSSDFYSDISFIDEPSKKANLNLNGDLVFKLDDYLFSFYFATSLVETIPFKQNAYSEYNIAIGKAFLNKNWFALEGHLGIGYFEEREQYAPNGPTTSYGTVGFPLRIKANFYLSKHVALGINPNANLNLKDSSIMSINLISQIRF